jgi:methyl-accepting chemotaxis protein
MKWFYDLKLTTKIISGFAIILMSAMAIGLIGIINIKNIDDAGDTTYSVNTVPLGYIGHIGIAFQRTRVNLRDMVIDKTEADRKKRIETIKDLDKEVEDNMKNFESSMKAKDVKDEFARLKNAIDKFAPVREKVMDLAYRNQTDKATELIRGEGFTLAMAIDDSILKLYTMKIDQAKERSEENNRLAKDSYFLMILFIVIGIVLSVISGLFITSVVRRQLGGEPTDVVAISTKIADGDFTVQVNVDGKDSTSALAAMKKMVMGLERVVSDIVVGSQNLVQAIQEISAGNENLSQRTSEQASSLEEVAATIEETSAAINQNAENARKANDIAVDAVTLAEGGGRVVSEAVSAINEINDASKKIEAIISVINEIAFQTNLLALNAAVEAARAGEQGRGFAVVAGEVRNLAQRSGSAAKEIGELIKTTVVKVDKGTALANKSGEALKEIIGSVKNVGRLVSEIHAASEEQKQGASQISIAVSELDAATQQNAGLVEETASASEEISSQAQELLLSMERFKISKDISRSSYDGHHKEVHLKQAIKVAGKAKSVSSSHAQTSDAAAINGGNGKGLEQILSKEGFEQF